MPPIEGRIERIGRFTLPDDRKGLETKLNRPFPISRGWTGEVVGINGNRVPLSRIAIKVPGQKPKEYPVRIHGKGQVTIRLKTRERNRMTLKLIP